MKLMIFVSAFFALSALSGYAQDPKGGEVLAASNAIEKPKEEKNLPLIAPKMTNAVLGNPVVYGGYFMEVLRAEKKGALFDLSAPLDPVKDLENVFFNSTPEVAQPIILFRIKF